MFTCFFVELFEFLFILMSIYRFVLTHSTVLFSHSDALFLIYLIFQFLMIVPDVTETLNLLFGGGS